jgi:hypothetical protein
MLVAAKKLGPVQSPAPRVWKPEIGTGEVSAEISPRQSLSTTTWEYSVVLLQETHDVTTWSSVACARSPGPQVTWRPIALCSNRMSHPVALQVKCCRCVEAWVDGRNGMAPLMEAGNTTNVHLPVA